LPQALMMPDKPIQLSLRTMLLCVLILGLSASIHKSLSLPLAMALDGLMAFLCYLVAVSYLGKQPEVAERILQFMILFLTISSVIMILTARHR
jgi:hypothetical protein